MNTLHTQLGWMFAALAALFALGLAPRLAPRFYSAAPSAPRRLAAPVLFAALAVACFLGAAVQALSAVVIAGMPLIVSRRWEGRKHRHGA